MVYTFHFETELYLPIFTRINSLLFRKRIVPHAMHIEKTAQGTYKASFTIETHEELSKSIAKQLERFVGVDHIEVKTER